MAANGEDLLNEVYDLMADGLRELPADDPMRGEIAEVVASLGARLGRPFLNVVPIRQEA